MNKLFHSNVEAIMLVDQYLKFWQKKYMKMPVYMNLISLHQNTQKQIKLIVILRMEWWTLEVSTRFHRYNQSN